MTPSHSAPIQHDEGHRRRRARRRPSSAPPWRSLDPQRHRRRTRATAPTPRPARGRATSPNGRRPRPRPWTRRVARRGQPRQPHQVASSTAGHARTVQRSDGWQRFTAWRPTTRRQPSRPREVAPLRPTGRQQRRRNHSGNGHRKPASGRTSRRNDDRALTGTPWTTRTPRDLERRRTTMPQCTYVEAPAAGASTATSWFYLRGQRSPGGRAPADRRSTLRRVPFDETRPRRSAAGARAEHHRGHDSRATRPRPTAERTETRESTTPVDTRPTTPAATRPNRRTPVELRTERTRTSIRDPATRRTPRPGGSPPSTTARTSTTLLRAVPTSIDAGL